MNALEKVGSTMAVVVFVFGLGAAWNSLNNRIDRVDEKMAAIQKTLGSTTCNAILTRQIEAIEKNKAEPRKALEALSSQYECLPRHNEVGWSAGAGIAGAVNVSAPNENALGMQLNTIDDQLNRDN